MVLGFTSIAAAGAYILGAMYCDMNFDVPVLTAKTTPLAASIIRDSVTYYTRFEGHGEGMKFGLTAPVIIILYGLGRKAYEKRKLIDGISIALTLLFVGTFQFGVLPSRKLLLNEGPDLSSASKETAVRTIAKNHVYIGGLLLAMLGLQYYDETH